MALPDLIDLAQSQEEQKIRALAFTAMSGLGAEGSKAVPPLKQAIQNREEFPEVRQAAIRALARLAPADADVHVLLRQVLHDQNESVRRAAEEALEKLGVENR